MARMNVSFKAPLIEELRRMVPRRQRSQFISEAVQEKLDQLKQEIAVRNAAGLWSSEGRRDPADEIRKQRGSWDDRGKRLGRDGG